MLAQAAAATLPGGGGGQPATPPLISPLRPLPRRSPPTHPGLSDPPRLREGTSTDAFAFGDSTRLNAGGFDLDRIRACWHWTREGALGGSPRPPLPEEALREWTRLGSRAQAQAGAGVLSHWPQEFARALEASFGVGEYT